MLSNRISKVLMSGAVMGALAGAADAALNIDLRATGLNGGALPAGSNSKNVIVAGVGDVVSFDILAVITGTNASITDDKFISAAGSFRSSNGGLEGNLIADVLRTQLDSDGSP